MGTYLNPGNEAFRRIRAGGYVDKTELVAELNRRIGTSGNLVCVSWPRRFGKSFAAQTLCAYYDRTCDSRSLFDDLRVASSPSYLRNLNAYDVIYVDMASMMDKAGTAELVPYLKVRVAEEVSAAYPEAAGEDLALVDLLGRVVDETGRRFVMIVDEWDAPIRELPGQQQAYLDFLRSIFKDSGVTPKVFAAAYMTGILPIKKDKGQSAVSDFREYSIIDPGPFAPCFGFLEDEAQELCSLSGLDFGEAKRWYDGYSVGEISCVYNPYSLMMACDRRTLRSYWRQTSAADTLLSYIDLDFEGLQGDIVRLMGGGELEVNTGGFSNDPAQLAGHDDALTLMTHLGYLTFERSGGDSGYVRIPNQEVRCEFDNVLRQACHPELVRLVRASDQLLADTIAGDAQAVAAAVGRVHDTNYAPAFYNGEQALRHTVKMAYITAIDQYARVEELPSGHGLADLVFLPKHRSQLPALVVELKWDRPAEGAVAQILDRNYPQVLQGFGGEVLLVGITYDEKDKRHTCVIRRLELAGGRATR